ncbi:hypothetical protein ACR6C2_07505 [Streptomyces sp. INA 01156]
MATEWYLGYGGVEVVNHSRLTTYLETVGSPLTGYSGCGCATFGPEIVGDLPYTTPGDEDSPAPWYDPDVPESAEFAGIMVLEVQGLDDHPVQRTVTGGIAGGGSIGPARSLPRTITVTALVLGSTCCGVDYGLHWLGQVLQGCTGGECDGDCLVVYNCCPGEELDSATFNERHRRTLRRTALVDGPRVTARAGDGCQAGECQSGADILTVEWVMTAAVPWLWTDPSRSWRSPRPWTSMAPVSTGACTRRAKAAQAAAGSLPASTRRPRARTHCARRTPRPCRGRR